MKVRHILTARMHFFQKIICLLSLFIFLFNLDPILAFAADYPSIQPVNSFELFWPLSAGKTITSKIYWLKQFKEKFRGAIIFGNTPKADYDVLLATKRLLETEKLLRDNQIDFANQTLDIGKNNLVEAKAKAIAAIGSKESFGSSGPTIVSRLSNMQKLGVYLQTTYPDSKSKLQEFIDADLSLLAILK